VFCATVLESAGYKVGLYTSPHLKDFEERIQINRQPIGRETLVDLVDELRPVIESIKDINTFEIMTALAFIYFSRADVDIAVIEVGLGGRLDATNVISPVVSVITALYLEHTNILGDTLSKIAFEKAGIIKTGIPVVLSPQRDEALQTVLEIANQRQAPVTLVGEHYQFSPQKAGLDGQTFLITKASTSETIPLEIGLLGQYQVENATTAYAALQILRDQGFVISESAIHEGFALTKWPARFEILSVNPTVVIDSAHNPDSTRRIRQAMEEYFPNQPLVVVFGVSEDKNITGIIEELLPNTIHFICSQSTHPRAMDAHELKNYFAPYNCPVKVCKVIGDALNEAQTIAGNRAVVLVTGSIFVAATARIAWFESRNIGWSKNVGLQLVSG
jgi:dihydrofolate synthase/folylpolyglutamate synthase